MPYSQQPSREDVPVHGAAGGTTAGFLAVRRPPRLGLGGAQPRCPPSDGSTDGPTVPALLERDEGITRCRADVGGGAGVSRIQPVKAGTHPCCGRRMRSSACPCSSPCLLPLHFAVSGGCYSVASVHPSALRRWCRWKGPEQAMAAPASGQISPGYFRAFC